MLAAAHWFRRNVTDFVVKISFSFGNFKKASSRDGTVKAPLVGRRAPIRAVQKECELLTVPKVGRRWLDSEFALATILFRCRSLPVINSISRGATVLPNEIPLHSSERQQWPASTDGHSTSLVALLSLRRSLSRGNVAVICSFWTLAMHPEAPPPSAMAVSKAHKLCS